MNEIAGKYQLDGAPIPREQVKRMLDAVASWPADREGIRQEGAIGLGTRQFFITREDALESLPLQVGPFVLTADARIDNRLQLIREFSLGSDDADPSISDGYLILKAYEKWGEDCPDHLIGDFAFAIWDARACRLFCARDAMGVRPFYYCHAPGKFFAFGTTIGMVLQGSDGVDTGLNELKLGLLMVLDYTDRENTLRKNIMRLPGGHCLTLGRENFSIRRYWDLEKVKEISLASDSEYAAGMRDVFFEAVRCRLRSAYPVGAQLSGGLDSSSVFCTASRLLDATSSTQIGQLHAFSVVFPNLLKTNSSIDENKYQQAVIDSCSNAIHHRVSGENRNVLHKDLWSFEQPILAHSHYFDEAVFEGAEQFGVHVILTGQDGDTVIFAGLTYLAELLKKFRLIEFIRQGYCLSRKYSTKLSRVIWRLGIAPFLNYIRTIRSSQRINPEGFEGSYPLINRDFADRIGLWAAIWRNRMTRRVFKNIGASRHIHLAAVTDGLWAFVLENIDYASRSHRIESRHPFFDRRVVEYSLALPTNQKLYNGVTRFVMHNAMRGIIPDAVNERMKKANLSAGFRLGMMDNIKAWMKNDLSGPLVNHYVDADYCTAVAKRILESNDLLSKQSRVDDDVLNLFYMMIIDRWLSIQSETIKIDYGC